MNSRIDSWPWATWGEPPPTHHLGIALDELFGASNTWRRPPGSLQLFSRPERAGPHHGSYVGGLSSQGIGGRQLQALNLTRGCPALARVKVWAPPAP